LETIVTGAHLHLVLNHVPVILVPAAIVMLLYAMASKSADLTKGALALLIVSTLFGAGAFLTGEPAEDALEQIPGISTEAMKPHENLATFAVAATALAGVFASVVFLKWQPGGATPWTMIATLVVALTAAMLLAWTAYLGGRINHPELREDPVATASIASEPGDTYVVSASGIAGIRLDMTLDEARRRLPAAKFERVSDGDGAALVEVTLAPAASMILWAEEDAPNAPIDWSKRVKTIETFSSVFHTVDGVHPGSLVVDVERVLGETKEIQKSEIESREFIAFQKQPANFTFRLDYTGIFPAASRTTTKFEPGAKIHSISVSSY
jgi:uncharacterized membrane protein